MAKSAAQPKTTQRVTSAAIQSGRRKKMTIAQRPARKSVLMIAPSIRSLLRRLRRVDAFDDRARGRGDADVQAEVEEHREPHRRDRDSQQGTGAAAARERLVGPLAARREDLAVVAAAAQQVALERVAQRQ